MSPSTPIAQGASPVGTPETDRRTPAIGGGRTSFLIAVGRADVLTVAVHALGWRQDLLNTRITSRLVAIDPAAGAAATYSGHIYRLAGPDGHDELPDLLHDHLRYALRTWGFDDVVSL